MFNEFNLRKNIIISFVLLSSISLNAQFKDTTRYTRFGIIPYQFFSRSFGVYYIYDFKNTAIEFRPSYTYSKNSFDPLEIIYDNERLDYQGTQYC